jgi:hypothetical protein
MKVTTLKHNEYVIVGDVRVTAYRDERGMWTINGSRSSLRFLGGMASIIGPHKGSVRVGLKFPDHVKFKFQGDSDE